MVQFSHFRGRVEHRELLLYSVHHHELVGGNPSLYCKNVECYRVFVGRGCVPSMRMAHHELLGLGKRVLPFAYSPFFSTFHTIAKVYYCKSHAAFQTEHHKPSVWYRYRYRSIDQVHVQLVKRGRGIMIHPLHAFCSAMENSPRLETLNPKP